MPSFSHLNEQGQAHMVDVGSKKNTTRIARAQARVSVNQTTFEALCTGETKKGDVFAAVRLAGIQASKRTSDLIPLCHPLSLSHAHIDIHMDKQTHEIILKSVCHVDGKTGVEMEALTAVSVAALTLYDMCKSMQRDIQIHSIVLLEKEGGKSGHFQYPKHKERV